MPLPGLGRFPWAADPTSVRAFDDQSNENPARKTDGLDDIGMLYR
jgi:hypothetical protein